MPKFLLIDHSLKGVGGHHYEYASHVLRAAETAGREIILAAHRRFRPDDGFPDSWTILPVFRHGTYCDYTIYHSQGAKESTEHGENGSATPTKTTRSFFDTLRGRFRQFRFDAGRAKRIRRFAAGVRQVLDQVSLAEDDVVFLPTLSELDLVGLAEALADDPQARRPSWHLQFHFSIFDGRESDYAGQQDQLEATQRIFQAARSRMQGCRTFGYNTTRELSEQYNRLDCGRFQALPYPVNEAFRPSRETINDADSRRRPLRVTCVGALRPEKGYRQFDALLRQMWSDYVAPRRMQLIVQSNKTRFQLPALDDFAESTPSESKQFRPVEYVPHPLSMDEYVELIRGADVGLLLYDSDRYYARCSGVLVEMLSVGTPVIATAGCWMAEQLAEANFSHHDAMAERLKTISEEKIDDVATPCDPSADEGRLRPIGANELLVRWSLPLPAESGLYVDLTVRQYDARGALIDESKRITGRRGDDRPSSALFRLNAATHRVGLAWRNAYGKTPIRASEIVLNWLSAAEMPGGTCPLGAVGLIAPDPSNAAPLLAEMLDHWPHYRRTAQEFSRAWSALHNPRRIVKDLVANAKLPASPSIAESRGDSNRAA